MIHEVGLALPLLVIGILLMTAHYTTLLPLNTAEGKVKQGGKNVNFEIFDCLVQGNSTYEKSGPCPDSASEALPDASVASEKVVTNTKSEISEEPKADSSTSTGIADTETKPDVTEEPKADSSGNNDVSDDTDQPSQTMTGEKYDFDQIHIAGPESSRENIEKSQADSVVPSDTLTPVDPFEPSVK